MKIMYSTLTLTLLVCIANNVEGKWNPIKDIKKATKKATKQIKKTTKKTKQFIKKTAKKPVGITVKNKTNKTITVYDDLRGYQGKKLVHSNKSVIFGVPIAWLPRGTKVYWYTHKSPYNWRNVTIPVHPGQTITIKGGTNYTVSEMFKNKAYTAKPKKGNWEPAQKLK